MIRPILTAVTIVLFAGVLMAGLPTFDGCIFQEHNTTTTGQPVTYTWRAYQPTYQTTAASVSGYTYHYRIPFNVTERSGSTLTDYPVQLHFDSQWAVDNTYSTDAGNELRITDTTNTVLSHWIETEWNHDNTIIWFKAPELIANSTTAFYLYIDAELTGASDVQDPTDLFPFFDHFGATTLNTDIWEGDTGYATVADSIMTLTGADAVWRKIRSKTDYVNNYAFRTLAKYEGRTATGNSAGAAIAWRHMDAEPLVDLIYFGSFERGRHTNLYTTSADIDSPNWHTYSIDRTSATTSNFLQDDVCLLKLTGGNSITDALPPQFESDGGVGYRMFADWALVRPCQTTTDREPAPSPLNSIVIFPNPPYTMAIEPTVLTRTDRQVLSGSGSCYAMWYRETYCNYAGTYYGVLSYAESLDGLTWIKHPSNPILSNAEQLFCPYVFYSELDSKYYLFVHGDTTGIGRYIDRWYSSNGISWTKDKDQALAVDDHPAWDSTGLGNNWVYQQNATSWYMLYEAYHDSDAKWSVGLATSSDGLTWSKYASNPIITGTGSQSCSHATVEDDTVTLYFHRSATGFLPSDIYTTTSTDWLTWTQPQLLYPRTQSYEGAESEDGQAADPTLIGTYMYHDAIWDQTTPPGPREYTVLTAYQAEP